MKRYLLATTILVATGASSAHADVVLNFGSLSIGGAVPCATDCVIGTGGLRSILDGVSAEGYNVADHASFLTQKPASDGSAETGIGESDGLKSSDPNHEIAVGRFVVIDNKLAETLGFEPKSFTIGSLQAGEVGTIYGYTGPDGSSDLVTGSLTPLATFTGGNTATLNVTGLDYDKYVFSASPSLDDEVFSNTLITQEVLSTVPEPSTWTMMLMGFVGFSMMAIWGRHKRPSRYAI